MYIYTLTQTREGRPVLPELTQQEYATALDAVAADVLCALSIDGPPVNAIELAQAMGLSIA